MGNWEDFIPAQFARFVEKDQEKHHKDQEKHHKAKAAASFLGVQETTSASDSVSLPAIAGLTLTGCALLLMASVRFTRRTVALTSEALG
jgi:hypothetical protein